MIPIVFWMITAIENAPNEIHKDNEDQPWKGFSVFLHVLLPIAGLALLWGQRGIFAKLLLQLDRSCVAVYCPSLSKREKLLKWASDRLPMTWSSQARTLSSGIPELWKDGSLLCTLINSVVPEACPNPHRHWRKPPLHAQALAYKYLGLVPMFTEDELSGEFTINQERNFIHYLHKLQEAINKWSTKDELSRKFSSQYVARGMGLFTGEQHRKTVFYIYAHKKTTKRNDVLMYIRGPYGTYGKATICPFHNLKTIPVVNVFQDQLEATTLLPFKNDKRKSFLKTISLDFTSLISNIESKSEISEIPIQIDIEIDRAKITYIPNDTGIHEINLICDGELLRGSPYSVQVIKNTAGSKENFNDDSETVEEKITFTKRKILSTVIDFIDKKVSIDNDVFSRLNKKDSSESSIESENDDITITATTKKKDEILKTEINCTLEDIIEEINVVQEKPTLDEIHSEKISERKPLNALDEIKRISEQLKTEIPHIVLPEIKVVEVIDTPPKFQVDTQHKIVNDCEEAKTEIINLLQKESHDEVDNIVNYNVNTEKELEVPEKTLISKLDIGFMKSTKFVQNIVTSTNKQGMLDKILPVELFGRRDSDEDENNNSDVPMKRIKSKIYVEISPKDFSRTNTSTNFPDITSPICPDHIAPEVEKSSLNQLPLSEKRKAFSKQDSVVVPDNDVPFSPENDDSSKPKDSDFRELSVLNVLDSLRQSRQNSFSESYSLTSTVSLPNITSVDSSFEIIDENIFRARKNYWERMSSQSSSSVSLAQSDCSHTKRNIADKNFFNRYHTIERSHNEEKNKIEKKLNASAGDLTDGGITAIENNLHKSVDTSLEDCTLVPLEQRKKQLLKNMYQHETRTPKKIALTINIFSKNNKSKNEEKNTGFSSISSRIQSFDKTSPKMKLKRNHSCEQPIQLPDDIGEVKKAGPKHTIKSQFKKAIKFFKNLEDSSKASKLKERKKDVIKRRYSLDNQKRDHRKVKGGSLNLPNISGRFSINNLYDDVFGSRSGSFKGIPNKIGVTSSLASLVNDVRLENGENQDENNISYNLFVNKAKSKKRRSIKSLFDVNY